MNKKIYYIETTLNGYIIQKKPICFFERDKDYIEDLVFKDADNKEVSYYNDIAGDYDNLDLFLKHGDHNNCNEYDNMIGEKSNIYLERWLYELYGGQKLIGLMVDY